MSALGEAEGHISKQSSSYRQGLVLGLTMAEVMILLVFCLLIALAAFLKIERSKRIDAEQQLAREKEAALASRHFTEALKKDNQLAEFLNRYAAASGQGKADELWRELKEVRGVVDAAKQNGLTSEDIRNGLQDLKTIKDKGLDISKASRDALIAGTVSKALGAAAPVTPGELERIIERGLKEPAPAPVASAERNKWPPIISLNDANGRFFKTGSAEVDLDFRQVLLDSTAPRIAELVKEYDVDVIEVVGHTDEQPVGGHVSNLDRDLVSVLNNTASIAGITPADNAGLGLARAVSVVGILRQSKLLSGYKILPLSGGQLINTDETLALAGNPGDIRERRRIEIRLRKATPKDSAAPSLPPPAAKTAPERSSPLPAPRPKAAAASSAPAPSAPLQITPPSLFSPFIFAPVSSPATAQ
jgi:flagellar motor protein MotB